MYTHILGTGSEDVHYISGEGVLPAVQLAMNHVNEDNSILPHHRLHLIWNDTQVLIYMKSL